MMSGKADGRLLLQQPCPAPCFLLTLHYKSFSRLPFLCVCMCAPGQASSGIYNNRRRVNAGQRESPGRGRARARQPVNDSPCILAGSPSPARQQRQRQRPALPTQRNGNGIKLPFSSFPRLAIHRNRCENGRSQSQRETRPRSGVPCSRRLDDARRRVSTALWPDDTACTLHFRAPGTTSANRTPRRQRAKPTRKASPQTGR